MKLREKLFKIKMVLVVTEIMKKIHIKIIMNIDSLKKQKKETGKVINK